MEKNKAISLHSYNSNSLLVINGKGLIRVLYTPFRVLCIHPIGTIPANIQVYVEEVCSNGKDQLLYMIHGEYFLHGYFQLTIKF